MTDIDTSRPTFDRVGLSLIERFWWDEEQILGLVKVLQQLLSPDAGHAWFRAPETGWMEVDAQRWDDFVEILQTMASVWMGGNGSDAEHFDELREKTACAVFLDAQRFRTCVPETDALPDDFFITLEVDWSFSADTRGTVFTPRLLVTNRKPTSEAWAPPSSPHTSDESEAPFSAEEAAHLLEQGYLFGVATTFRALESSMGISPASMVLGDRPQRPPIFYYAAPTHPPAEGSAYLEAPLLECMGTLGQELLDSPDIRSTEITGGVMEGCLTVFNHSPTVQAEYCLILPTAGFDEDHLESKLRFVTSVWHEIDFDATWEIYDITTDLEAEQQFFSLWMGSLDTAMTLNEILFSLLRKASIQVRMFSLAQLLNGFLANLHARTYAGAKKRTKFKRNLEWSIGASRTHAQRRFTVREIPGVDLPRNISDGYTRAYRAFETRIGQAVDDAHALSTQIEDVSKSLSYTAGLEEERQERERKLLLDREEKAAKRLNLVLALVAVLAAIPLIVGQFDNTALAAAMPWFPFGLGLHFSFWVATLAFVATLTAIVLTLVSGKNSADADRDGPIATVNRLADEIFDCYRAYEHNGTRGDLFAAQEAGKDADAPVREACARAHAFDLQTARAVARAYEQAEAWRGYDDLPVTDEEWARSMEARVCRFVLLSDVFDLRPERLNLPLTLCLYRLKYEDGGLGSNPVSDWELQVVMRAYGYTTEETEAIESWAQQDDVMALSPTDFVEACVAQGITVAHRLHTQTPDVSHI